MIGVILAGGESRRFGSQKALYELEGKPFYQYVYDTLVASSQFEQVVINTNAQLKDAFKQEVIVDDSRYQGLGPMAGIYTVMAAVPDDAYFVVSVDTPFLTTEAVNYLIEHFQGNTTVYRDYEQIHATIGIYPHKLKKTIKQYLDHRDLRLRALFDEETTYIDVSAVPGHWYQNINRPEDLKGV
ncbi:molybdenum cofactor guanylyltransferase MobA [Macrococcus brunensis]|uniref:molybdenum cofactor guanylyltransferase MobA n=1 Tax=Macrococcus brunensis TaxID=198483 RepID=UPI001EF08484|nr:molybdenum cofactor guanylyltransferase MobA [Macrococcus brunensis]ULG72105.1 molybdenum cofactor guanylyltransferase MobA [Macrococcus brunensis]